MKLKFNYLITLIFLLIISSCTPTYFLSEHYTPQANTKNPINLASKIKVNIIPDFPEATKIQIEKSINDDFKSLFTNSVWFDEDINVVINVKYLKFKEDNIGFLWLPLIYLGVPMSNNSGAVNIDLLILDKDNKLIKGYNSKNIIKKWQGLYWGYKYTNYKKNTYLVYQSLSLAIEDIKLQIQKDSDHIYSYIESNKSKNDVILQKNEKQELTLTEEETTQKKEIDNNKSDIDQNIPYNATYMSNRFALIIGNEDYKSYQLDLGSEVNVDYAINDANSFKQYANKTLRIPDENTIFLTNAKTVEMHRAFEKLNLIAKNSKGEAELFIYYAGHGLPDEVNKEPYIIPVDVSNSDLKYALSLKEIYSELTEYPTKRITVFLDACFSGGGRNQGLLAARGVKIKPKDQLLKGNLIVFSASSESQSALPYSQEQHGLFTYYLLKKIKETKGNLTYAELYDYVEGQVSIKSILVNNKEQNPKMNISSDIIDEWKKWKLNE